MTYKYTLEPYKGMSSRYHCPSCRQKDKTFSRYINTDTGEHLHKSVGRCSRESNCGYHYTPKKYFQDNNIYFDKSQPITYRHRLVTPQPKAVSFIPFDIFKGSLANYANNNFVKYLINLFGVEITTDLISKYYIGSSNHWNGATVFWQVDAKGKVRTGKIMLYSPTTGKRVKEPYNHINWVHKVINKPEFELRQSLFGEHLINQDFFKPIAIVESEKTAVIASVYLPQFIWLAVGSLTNLNAEKCSVLKGRSVTLFPDLNGFEKWSSKVKELSHLANFRVSDLLERKATNEERKQGLDLADYLINYDYKAFVLPVPDTTTTAVQSFSPTLKDSLSITETDIISLDIEVKTGKEFNNMIIATISTIGGNIYDILFDSNGNGIEAGMKNETAEKLENFFNKRFYPALLYGENCLIHTIR